MSAPNDQVEPVILVECPACDVPQRDHDGFGVLHCTACGYCRHPAADGKVVDGRTVYVCGLCSAEQCEQCDGRGYRETTTGVAECADCGGRGWTPVAELTVAFQALHQVYHERDFRVRVNKVAVSRVGAALAETIGVEYQSSHCPACKAGHWRRL